ncbi:unnamed protein product, partial [Rhizoctonia solani]
SNPPTEDEVLRENELRYSDEFFGAPLAEGAQMARHDNTQESAYNIIRALLQRGTTVPQISKELVDKGLKLEATSAGAILGKRQEEEMNRLAEEIRKLRNDHAQGLQRANEMYERMLEEQGWAELERCQFLEWQIASLEQEHELDQIAWEQEWEDYIGESAVLNQDDEAMVRTTEVGAGAGRARAQKGVGFGVQTRSGSVVKSKVDSWLRKRVDSSGKSESRAKVSNEAPRPSSRVNSATRPNR